MPIVDLIPTGEEESGIETQDNRRFTGIATYNWTAVGDSPGTDTADLIRAQSGLFAGGPHPSIPFLWATKIVCKRVSPIYYELRGDYATRGAQGQGPLDEPPIISWGYALSEDIIDRDVDGKPMIMITGEQFDPPIRDTVYDQVVRCQRNISFDRWNPDLTSYYAGKTNSDTFLWFPPGTCRIVEPPTATSKNYDNYEYWDVTMGVQIRRGVQGIFEDSKAWYIRRLAAGFYVAGIGPTGANGQKPKPMIPNDSKGAPITKPVMHDKVTGQQLANDPNTGLPDPTLAQFYEFLPWTRTQVPFSDLNVA